MLSELRDEAQNILDLNPGIALDEFFHHGPTICHMASSDNIDPTLEKESVRVVINTLATTRKAATIAAKSHMKFPQPGLDGPQMDSFINISNRMSRLGSLTSTEVCHLTPLRSFSDPHVERHYSFGSEDL